MGDIITVQLPIRWYNSLVVRVVLLCGVLLLCLFGSVYVITRFYFHQLVSEMEIRTKDIASDVKLWLDANDDSPEQLTGALTEMESMYGGVKLDLQPIINPETTRVTPKIGDSYFMEATHTIVSGDKIFRLIAQFELRPQTELVLAFRNKYLLAITLGFVVALGLMLYFIIKALHPLRELAESCSAIGAGNLKDVVVRKNYGEILSLEQTFNRMVSSLRDKEMMEANLRQAQRLSALGNLAAGVAHDLRNPLNSIKLLSSHTLDTLGESSVHEEAALQIKTIRSEVDRLEEIVSSFLSLAKERELVLEPTPVDAVLEECVELIHRDAELREIRLISELRTGDTSLMLDKKHFARAIINVLINALEACPKSGRVRLFSRLTDTTCEIEIRDDGPGMPKEIAERAFEPYYTTKNTGTGLGLAITRGIIEEHGGRIQLSSSNGEGCQVLITLLLERTKK